VTARRNRRRADRDPALRYRASRTVESHPWWTLGGVSSLAAFWPILLFLGAVWTSFVDTPDKAKEREAAVKQEAATNNQQLKAETNNQIVDVYKQIAAVRTEMQQHEASDSRTGAGTNMLLLEGKLNAAVRDVNGCSIMRSAKKQLTQMEYVVCADYDRNYAEAKRRYENAQNSATQAWRGQ